MDALPDAVAIHRNDQLLYVNVALAALLGEAGTADMLASRLPHWLQERAAKHQKLASPMEVRIRRSDGAALVAEVSSIAIEFDGGPAVLSVLRDATERRQMQAQLLLADRMASVGRLAAGVAHEINNPMAYVTANLGFASDNLKRLGEELRGRSPDVSAETTLARFGARLHEICDALDEARQGTLRVRQIVRDLRTFSRDEEERRPVDVRRVLESAINVAWNEIRQRARLVKLYSDVPRVLATEARLGQVFLNLLLNAVQAIPETSPESNEIRVSTRVETNDRVVIEIRDTGIGIEPDLLPRIFDPFFTTKPSGVGTGLGLAIVHGIVTSLGGEISIDTEVGHGSTFRVSLPASESLGTGVTGAHAQVVPATRRMRLLVIDDEPLVLRAVKRLLESEQEITTATGGREALALLVGGERFDVIFCDLMMPEMNGMDLHAELVRRIPEQAAQMVFLTGGAYTAAARDFLDKGKFPLLEKPVEVATLRELLHKRMTATGST